MKKGSYSPFKEYYRNDLKDLIKTISGKDKTALLFKEKHLNKLSGKTHQYIALVNLIGDVPDIQAILRKVRSNCTQNTRLIITYYNYLWEPILKLAEFICLKEKQHPLNWLTLDDIENLLYLTDFQAISRGQSLLLPLQIPILSPLFNRFFAKLPLVNKLCLTNYIVARPINFPQKPNYSVSVIIPARNEAGNIKPLIKRIPRFTKNQEIIIVEGHSQDNTWEMIQKVKKQYSYQNLQIFKKTTGIGKSYAVYHGIKKSRGDIIIILDSDISVAPEDLPKFYQALLDNRGEFVNGTRLVYPLQSDSMRFLNIIANKLFSIVFSWTLNQRFTDTLCGTKAFYRKDFNRIMRLRKYFCDFDPFGDFNLIFGSIKLNLKVTEVPVRYYARTYGRSNIKRFTHGFMLLKMWLFALKIFKFS